MLVRKRQAVRQGGSQPAEAARVPADAPAAGPAEPLAGRQAQEPLEAPLGLRTRGVTLAAALLMLIQLLWMVDLLTHSYFRQDDFSYLYSALGSHFDWKYLMWEDAGQLQPFGMALFWALARVSLYNWPMAAVVTIVLLIVIGLAMLRMLRTLFGNRPAILAPFAVFLFSPLQLGGVSWLSVAVDLLPVELALCMAVTAHVHYLRNGRTRHTIAAAGWLLIGMAASDKGAVVPLLLFALTSAFFVAGPWAAAMANTAIRYWRAWLVYGVVLATWAAVYLIQLSTSTVKPSAPSSAASALAFVSTLTGAAFLPAAMGGPWQWSPLGYAAANPPPALQQLSWAVFAIVVVLSCACRVRAWRAWAILAGWIVATDMVPVILGRLGNTPGILLGTQVRYLEDAAPVLALCAALAFLPLAQEQGAIRLRLPAARPAIALLLAVVLIGSFWSLQSFQSQNNADSVAARSYIATARAAVTAAPPGTLIVDGPTPEWVMAPQIFGPYSYTSRVIGAIARGEPAKHLAWTAAPRGVPSSLMAFNGQGQLLPAAIAGPVSGRPPAPPVAQRSGKHSGKSGKHSGQTAAQTSGPRCWGVTTAGVRIPLNGTLYRWAWIVRLDYSGPAASAAVNYGGAWAAVALPAGTHSFYLPVTGGGSAVTVRLATPAPGWCLSGLAVGSLHPAPAGPAIPPVPVSG